MVVPRPVGGSDEVTRLHLRLFPRYGGVGAAAFDHHAQCRRHMAVGRRDLAGHDELHAAEQGLSDARAAVQTGIQVHQDASLGLLGRDSPASFEDARPDVRPPPEVGHDLGVWLGRERVAEHEP